MTNRHKRGDAREDGLFFWQYKKDKEVWITEEKLIEKRKKNLEYQKNFYPKIKDKALKYLKEYRKKNKDKCDKLRKSWFDRNPEKTAEMRRRASLKYAKNNRDKCSVRENKRRQLKEASNNILSEDDKKLMQIIYQCRKRIYDCSGLNFHVDHIMPLSKGGLHIPLNLRIIPARENLKKHNKIVDSTAS
jgi:hypothetical protein